MRVSVVVPARDAEATLGRTLDALARQELDEEYEVIVVDDGSVDGTASIAEGAGVTVLRQDRRGPAPARNRGVAHARGELLAFTDADCFPLPGWVAAGIRALESAELVQGAVHPDPSVRPMPLDRTIAHWRETPLFETANLLVRRELFERLGGFEQWIDPEIGKAFGEDIWLGWRARRAGARVAFAGDAVVHHAVFRRSPAQYLEDHRRLRYFPAACALVPELRRELLFGRVFLSRRSATFDAAVLGFLTALASRRRLPLIAAFPYCLMLLRESAPWRSRAPTAAVMGLLRDGVGFGSLLRGSWTYRSPVL
ncbi:MAG: glycosyltransferase family 2 protein [Gaiellaceae bacterium]